MTVITTGFRNGILQCNTEGLFFSQDSATPKLQTTTMINYQSLPMTVILLGKTNRVHITTTVNSGTYTFFYGLPAGPLIFFDILVEFTTPGTATGDLCMELTAGPFSFISPQNFQTGNCVTTGIPWPNNTATTLNFTLTNVPTILNPVLAFTTLNDNNTPANIQVPTAAGTYQIQVSGMLTSF
jgi:hypothetical protein